MRPTRTLRLRREPLAALDRAELTGVVGGLSIRDLVCLDTLMVCNPTREPACQWRETYSPWECLTLGPCV